MWRGAFMAIVFGAVAVSGCNTMGEQLRAGGAAPAAESAPVDRQYRIGPEDVLEISVWKEEGLQKEVLVRPDGGISFPLAGDVDVAGKTIHEVQTEITERISEYIPDAVVTVSVQELSGYRVFVLGKVNKPGQYIVGRYLDVIQALTLAGGLTPFAAEDDIMVLRRMGDEEKVFRFNYSDIKQGRDLEQNIPLHSGDVVVVP
ncbi:polysaccharide biosynthesis/export family protein [Arhodomonas sp. AD133]|uniref:polysaccharide biosynthesis/export family protein n=1 Tax=Arhodomonas sp. AD133 TaxID=3415009 RepID=UPI003EBEF6C4